MLNLSYVNVFFFKKETGQTGQNTFKTALVTTNQLNTDWAPWPCVELIPKDNFFPFFFFTPALTHLLAALKMIHSHHFLLVYRLLFYYYFCFFYFCCVHQNILEPSGRQQGRNACELWRSDNLETDISCCCLLSRRFLCFCSLFVQVVSSTPHFANPAWLWTCPTQ